jgi:hypothetical protein
MQKTQTQATPESQDARHPWRVDYPVQLDTPEQCRAKNRAGGEQRAPQSALERAWTEVQAKTRAGLGWTPPHVLPTNQ